ncbi:MAG: hypothetical protein ACXWIW_11805, partial [Croceibacterium sp.]
PRSAEGIMASGDDKAASQAGHMAAPTSNADAQLTLANGEPSTHGAKPPFALCRTFHSTSPAIEALVFLLNRSR